MHRVLSKSIRARLTKKIKYRPYGLIIIFKPAQPCILYWQQQQQQQLSIR